MDKERLGFTIQQKYNNIKGITKLFFAINKGIHEHTDYCWCYVYSLQKNTQQFQICMKKQSSQL